VNAMKKLLPLAIAAALVVPVAAMADATVYGKIRTSVDYVDTSPGNLFEDITDDLLDSDANSVRDDSVFEINSWASRLGVKGSEDLGDGLKAIYQVEGQVNFADQTNEFGTATALLTGRNTFVGLAGGFGTVLLGRHDTPMKMSTGKLDYFADTAADYNGYTLNSRFVTRTITVDGRTADYTYKQAASFSDRRADGTLAYVSPNWAGLTLAGAIIPGENQDANSLADAYSVAAMYENGGIYLAGAYEAADGETDLLNVTAEPGDHSQWRVGGGYDAGGWKVAAVYENEVIEWIDGNDQTDTDRWDISGAFTLGMGEIKATYFDWEDNVTSVTGSGFSLGYDYNFSKRTQLYALYHDSTIEQTNWDDAELSVVSVGLNHSF
jgi:predicted porin